MVHIEFDGKSYHLDESEIDIEDQAPERRIRHAVASFLAIDPGRLDGLVVERMPSGDILVMPLGVAG